MTLHMVRGQPRAEEAADLERWLHDLPGGPPVSTTAAVECSAAEHAEPATWFYVEADPDTGVARRRCLGCGTVRGLLDSEAHWTHPPMWACDGCSNSIAELAVALSTDPPGGPVRWLALGARCVECGSVSGLTDVFVAGVPVDEVLAAV